MIPHPFLPMDQWDNRNETVLLLVDYSDGGENALDDALIAITIGHNNDHNVGEAEGSGWQFAGWNWCQDHYTEGKGKPIGWMPLPHGLARVHENRLYPHDGGLREPVRAVGEGLSAFDVIRDHFETGEA